MSRLEHGKAAHAMADASTAPVPVIEFMMPLALENCWPQPAPVHAGTTDGPRQGQRFKSL